MLSEERIEEIANEVAAPVSRYLPYWRTSVDFARAIEAAVLPEGWVAVPKEPTLAMLDCLRADITSNLEKRYQAMIAAAPKPAQCNCQQGQVCPVCDPDLVPAQASPLDLMECLQDRPVEPSKAVQGKCVTQAEKQEPVKDDPVAWRFSKGTITKLDSCPHGGNWQPLYIHPQPDLTAEVERLKAECDSFCMNYRMKCDLETKQQAERIAELEEAAREARDTLQYKLHVVEAIAKLDWVLGGRI